MGLLEDSAYSFCSRVGFHLLAVAVSGGICVSLLSGHHPLGNQLRSRILVTEAVVKFGDEFAESCPVTESVTSQGRVSSSRSKSPESPNTYNNSLPLCRPGNSLLAGPLVLRVRNLLSLERSTWNMGVLVRNRSV